MNACIENADRSNFLLAFADSRRAQHDVLMRRIIAPNQESEFAKQHGFSSIRSVTDFQRAVPVRAYEQFRRPIERMLDGEPRVLTTEAVRRFFITSGSASEPKYIPVTASFIRDKSQAFKLFWQLVGNAYPRISNGSMIFNFTDTGSERSQKGTLCSSESSFWSACWQGNGGKARCPFPREIMNVSDAEARYYAIARIILETDVTALMTLNPSTILLLSEIIHRHAEPLLHDIRDGGISTFLDLPRNVRDSVNERFKGNQGRAQALEKSLASTGSIAASQLWPDLQLIISWRSEMLRPYMELLGGFTVNLPHRDYLSMASEGIMTIPFRDNVSGGMLPVHTHFFEFIPGDRLEENTPPTLLAHEIEVGKTYCIVLTTSGGLYRYNIGDVVRVKQFNGSTPVLEFLHRAGLTCSLTGEKLTESQVAVAVREASQGLGRTVKAATLCPATRPFPHYLLLAEIETQAENEAQIGTATGAQFLADLDNALAIQNPEYRLKRHSLRLGAPELWILRPGSYASLRQKRITQGANEAQVKIPCLTRDFDWWRQFQIVERVSCVSHV